MKDNIMRTQIIPLCKGVLITYGLLILLSLIGAVIAYFTGLKSEYYHSLGAVCIVVSLFFGGFFAARAGFDKGWLKGLSVGLICALIMLLISLTAPLSIKEVFSNGIYFIISAGIGGICGII